MIISCLKSLHSLQMVGTEALWVQDWSQCPVKCSNMWLFSLCLSLHLDKPNQGFCAINGTFFFFKSAIQKETSVHATCLTLIAVSLDTNIKCMLAMSA